MAGPPGARLSERPQVAADAVARLRGRVDIVAVQDGHVDYAALQEYLAVNAELARRHGLQCWSNVETFDRDLFIWFYPPIAWTKLTNGKGPGDLDGII